MHRRQHYVSQVEQRLNSFDDEKAYVYRFRIKNKEESILYKPEKRPIAQNLQQDFLFTIQHDSETHSDLEREFYRYEKNHEQDVALFLEKREQKAFESILKLKMINYIRNPSNIDEVVAMLESYRYLQIPDDSQAKTHLEYFKNPESKRLYFERNKRMADGVDEKTYDRWVYSLSMLLRGGIGPKDNIQPLHDYNIEQMIKNNVRFVWLFQYSQESPVFGDRSMTEFSFNVWNHPGQSMFFSLNNRNFVVVPLVNLARLPFPSPEFFHVDIKAEQLDQLAAFNQRVIDQSYEFVFSSMPTVHGAIIDR